MKKEIEDLKSANKKMIEDNKKMLEYNIKK